MNIVSIQIFGAKVDSASPLSRFLDPPLIYNLQIVEQQAESLLEITQTSPSLDREVV